MLRFVLLALVIVIATLQLSLALPNEWALLAHGVTRTPYTPATNAKPWSITSDDDLNLILWQVPFQLGATLYGGIDQSLHTGNIHVQVCGADYINLGPEWPGGGALKRYGPPYIWQIDSATGATVRVYDLSAYGRTFYSIVRYTPAGNPVVAVCDGNAVSAITIVILDTESDRVLWSFKPRLEPMLVQVTNTAPPQLLYAGMNSDGALSFVAGSNMSVPDASTEVVNTDISTIIFGADGRSIFNNGFTNEATGIYAMAMPLQAREPETLLVPGCETFPWVMASDDQQNLFAVCSYSTPAGIVAYAGRGQRLLWSAKLYPSWLVLSDDASIVIAGTTAYWTGFDAQSGALRFNTTLAELRQASDDAQSFRCYESGQPWAPRHPIPMADNTLAILCSNHGDVFDVRMIDMENNGAMVGTPFIFDGLSVVNMLVADESSFYGFGYNLKKISVQRVVKM